MGESLELSEKSRANPACADDGDVDLTGGSAANSRHGRCERESKREGKREGGEDGGSRIMEEFDFGLAPAGYLERWQWHRAINLASLHACQCTPH